MGVVAALMLLFSACQSAPLETSSKMSPETIGHVYLSADGQRIEIVNPSEDTTRLLDWAFLRFREAGLVEPRISKIHFGSESPGCASRSGWTRQTDNGVEVAICLDDDRICQPGNGSPLTAPSKFCTLHELAHGWLIEYASEETRSAFLDHAGLDRWIPAEETPWHQRGVEYAAEVVAWGLMDDVLDLIRLESPDCEQLEARFTILTGIDPLVSCPAGE